jgi:shikimate dehydrogenase
MQFGLIGEKLGHSFSKQIHGMLGDYHYDLVSLPPEALGDFLKSGSWRGLNVTLPYKQAVIPYCDELSKTAKDIGSVNVLLRTRDGRIKGDNTDLFGFSYMAKKAGISFTNKKVLVFGSGGTSLTAQAATKAVGAKEIVVVSRKGPVTYEKLGQHKDADCIINATPVGMYPDNGSLPVDLDMFPGCSGVLDVIFNPLRTRLLLSAQKRGIPCGGGLIMLVAQAKLGAELFTGKPVAEEKIGEIYTTLCRQLTNIVLIGMPGCGKSTLGRLLAEKLGRPHVEVDDTVAEKYGLSAGGMIEQKGEEAFRLAESEAITEIGKRTGIVISTGGGAVTRRENCEPLKQNGMLFFLERDLELLATEDRPLSRGMNALEKLYQNRLPLYQSFADGKIDNNSLLERAGERVMEVFNETAGH